MDRKTIETPLKKYISKVTHTLNPESIILYGSFARGKATEWSDIDLLVIGNFTIKSKKKLLDALFDLSRDIETEGHIFDVRGLTKEEFERASHLTIYHEAKKEGVTVYRKNEKKYFS